MTKKTRKSTSKNSITKASSLKTSLSFPTSHAGQLTTPTKYDKIVEIITQTTSPNNKMKLDNTTAPIEVEPRQNSKTIIPIQ